MGRINPKEDAEILDTELIFADMEMAENVCRLKDPARRKGTS